MPIPLIAYGLAIGGSVAIGYGMDKLFGDGHYTAKEATIDVVLGAAGIGIIKVGSNGVKAARHYRLAHKASKADDLVRMRQAANVGTAYGMEAAGHATIVRGAAKYDSAIRASDNIRVGIVPGVIDDSIVVMPPSFNTVVSTSQSTAVIFPTRQRCEHMFKGKRCRRLAGHSGRHRYG